MFSPPLLSSCPQLSGPVTAPASPHRLRPVLTETVWNNSNIPEEAVVSQGGPTFYAKTGSYIYEIVATWNDNGAGYSGTANYYVYIIDSTD